MTKPQQMGDKANHQRLESEYSNNYSLLEIYEESDDDGEFVENSGGSETVLETLELNTTNLNNTSNKPVLSAKVKLFIKPLTAEGIEEIVGSDFDRYGFKKASLHQVITKEQYNEWFRQYAEHSAIRMKKWQTLMKSNGLNIDHHEFISRFPPKSDKVKKLIRHGIPGEWRGSAWFFYAGGNEKMNRNVGVYDKIVRDTKNVVNKDTEAIERDLNRTFPDNIYFNINLTQPGPVSADMGPQDLPMIHCLRRVLVAFSHYQPQIGYCQSLNFLAGLLLLFMNEERTFWMMIILTERIIPKVHSRDLEGVHKDQGVLMLCIKEYIPQLWEVLGKTFEGEIVSEDKILTKLPPVTLVTSSWFMSMFVGIIPVESVLRIWDILWYEGSKTLFRFSLTICKLCLDSNSFKYRNKYSELEQIELFQFMQSYPKTLLDPGEIIDKCFKKIGGYGYGSLSQDQIDKCREFVAKQRENIKKRTVLADLSDNERKVLGTDVHDIYGFHRSIMSGVAWNNNISNKMKKRFSRKSLSVWKS